MKKVKIYKGIDQFGNLRSGKIEVPEGVSAYEVLTSQGIKPIKIEEPTKSFWKKEIFRRKPSQEDLAFVLTQLSLLLSSGLNLLKALETASQQVEDRRIKQALLSVKEAIEKGEPIHTAFEKGEIFPEFILEMLKTAERGENLEKVLDIGGEFLRRMSEVRAKVFSSLTYPAFVIVFSFLSVLLVVKFVIPKVASVLSGLGKELPLITKILLFFSNLLGYAFYLLPLALVLLLLRRRLISKESLDRYFLKIPIFGKVSFYFQLSRFAGSLRMALFSGIPMVRALSLSIGSITNEYIRKKLEDLPEQVAKGKSLSELLRSKEVFPPLFVSLLAVGEKSGELERSLSLLERVYDQQAMRVINLWLRLAEPIAMLVIGILVAFVVLSVILPISEISGGVRR
ncbi:type II secretion system F family protein [Thermocrinis sp.]|uniref:type II secretion system F family protein n=1 Tax=Thermocrinis sp. TaxID=2024383 RepID=UPI002FDDD6A2